MKKLMIATLVASSLFAVPTIAQAEGAGQRNDKANCLATERAGRNSKGGDREKGGFGQEQAAYVAWINSGASEYMSYGEFLQWWKSTCS